VTISYIDVSNHNGTMPLQAGTVACFAKSSEGTGYRDAYYGHFKAEAQRVGALFGAYHFLTEGNGAAQARFAYSIVGSSVPMMIDFEPEYDANGNAISLPSLADAIAFRDTYRSLGGLVRVNYLPRWYWAGHLGSPSLAPLSDLALVASDYTAYSDTGPGWEPYGGLTPAIWQYTDKLPYSGQLVDFNAYRGTVHDFAALLGLSGGSMTLSTDQENQLLNDTHNVYVATFYGGPSTGTQPTGAPNNSLVNKLDYLIAQGDALTAAVAKLVSPTIPAGDLANAVKTALTDPAVAKFLAHALAVELHNDTPPS